MPLRLAADRRLRVCLFTREYPPQGHGGIGQWTREVATGLVARGHEATVISRALDGRPNVDFVEGVFVHRIDAGPISSSQAQAFAPAPASLTAYSLALLAEVERIDPRRRFDLISGPIADLEAMASLALAAVPVVVSLHTTYKLSLPHKPDWLSRPDYLAGHVEPAIAAEGALIADATHLLANSRVILDDIEAAHGLKIDRAKTTIIPHGDQRSRARRPRPQAATMARRICCSLAGSRSARAPTCCWRSCPTSSPRIRRWSPISSATTASPPATRRCGGAMRTTTPVAPTCVRARNSTAPCRAPKSRRITPPPTFSSRRPNTNPSASSSSRRCASANPWSPMTSAAPPRSSQIGVDGLLAPAGAPQGLAAAISRLVEDRTLREELGRNARRTYEKAYTTELMIDRLEAYYRSVRAARPLEATRLSA